MIIQTHEIDNVVILSIEGGLFWEREDDFFSKLREIYEQRKFDIVVDFEKCCYITCSHLDMLFQFKKKFQAKGGGLKIACISSLVEAIFENSDLPDVVDVFTSVETAVASYKANKV